MQIHTSKTAGHSFTTLKPTTMGNYFIWSVLKPHDYSSDNLASAFLWGENFYLFTALVMPPSDDSGLMSHKEISALWRLILPDFSHFVDNLPFALCGWRFGSMVTDPDWSLLLTCVRLPWIMVLIVKASQPCTVATQDRIGRTLSANTEWVRKPVGVNTWVSCETMILLWVLISSRDMSK